VCLQIAAALVTARIPVLLLDMIVASLNDSTAAATSTTTSNVNASAQQPGTGAATHKPSVSATKAPVRSS
jgi:hypothetical protein